MSDKIKEINFEERLEEWLKYHDDSEGFPGINMIQMERRINNGRSYLLLRM